MVHCIIGATERHFPAPDQRNDEWWRMGERERSKEKRRRRSEKQKRNKENKCGERLFIWRGVITIRQGEASTFAKGVIPEERKKLEGQAEGGGRICERRETHKGGKRQKKSKCREWARAAAALKNIWEPSGRGEKNAGLSWNSRLPSLHRLRTRLLHIQLTPSPKRHKVEEGKYSQRAEKKP